MIFVKHGRGGAFSGFDRAFSVRMLSVSQLIYFGGSTGATTGAVGVVWEIDAALVKARARE